MKAEIIKIGNSKGIRIPKKVLEQCGFNSEVELEIDEGKLVITPAKKLREGWEDAYKAMAAADEVDPALNDWDAASPDPDEIDWVWDNK